MTNVQGILHQKIIAPSKITSCRLYVYIAIDLMYTYMYINNKAIYVIEINVHFNLNLINTFWKFLPPFTHSDDELDIIFKFGYVNSFNAMRWCWTVQHIRCSCICFMCHFNNTYFRHNTLHNTYNNTFASCICTLRKNMVHRALTLYT